MKTFVKLLLIVLAGGGILSAASAAEGNAASSKPLTSFDEAVRWLQVHSHKLIRAVARRCPTASPPSRRRPAPDTKRSFSGTAPISWPAYGRCRHAAESPIPR